jgi:hypothetical protein
VWAVTIPDGLVYAIMPVLTVALLSLVAYLFRQNARSNEALARTAQSLEDLGHRVNRLEDRVFPVDGRREGR